MTRVLRMVYFLVLLMIVAPRAQAQTLKTVLDGVYSDTQAVRGDASFRVTCGRCHAEDQSGHYPLLNTKQFVDHWREYPVDTLFTFIRDNMPPRREGDKASSIPDATYLDIVAYILKMNGYPTGQRDLTIDSVRESMLVGKDGPQPPPDNAVVMTIGCLSQTPTGSWNLTNAVVPVRNRKPDEALPTERTAPTQKSSGRLVFRLADLEALPDFDPAQHKDHRMLVKGYLIRQPNAERINLTLIEMLDSSCLP